MRVIRNSNVVPEMYHRRREAIHSHQPYLMVRGDEGGNGDVGQHVEEPQTTAISHTLPKPTMIVVIVLVVVGFLLIAGE